MSRCVVVLGMHRSGTSCVTRMLHHLGVYLGENVDDEPAPTNLTGHWEARDVVAINDQILAQSGGAWDNVPERLSWNTECEEGVKQLLSQFAVRPLYGWKDPRTTITFPAWKPHLPEYSVLACIRHPLAVAESLEVRDGFDLERGLRLWTAYNQHLLRHLSHERDVLWFPYDEPPEIRRAHLIQLCDRLGRPFREDLVALFNPYLRHCQAGDHPAAAEAIELYNTLLGMSRNALSMDARNVTSAESDATSTFAEQATQADIVAATARERNLEEVLRNFSATQQKYWRVIYEAQRIAAENVERIADERLAHGIEWATMESQRITVLEARLDRETERVTAEHQRVVALEERLTHEIERARIEGHRIAALEERVARAEATLSRNGAVRLLASVPGVRPMYRMARQVLHANR
jgi:hypothetical protein